MKRKLKLLLAIAMSFSLTSCIGGTINSAVSNSTFNNEENISNNTSINSNQNSVSQTSNNQTIDSSSNSSSDEEIVFKICLNYNGILYLPKTTENIEVILVSDYHQTFTKKIDFETGYATFTSTEGVDGEYHVHLNTQGIGGTSKKPLYTYNPNIYNLDNEHPNVNIELLKIDNPSDWSKPGVSLGSDFYDNVFSLTDPGTYSVQIKKDYKKNEENGNNENAVKFKFKPKKPGYYTIETMVDIYDNNVNPIVEKYEGSPTYINYVSLEKLNTGGASSTYTKNVKWEMDLYDVVNEDGDVVESFIGNVFPFAVYAALSTGSFPVTIYFTLTYTSEHYEAQKVADIMYPQEIKGKTPNYSSSNYTWVDAWRSDHILHGEDYKYNSEDGYWHKYDSLTNTWGPILCAKINVPPTGVLGALTDIEMAGNKALTVSNGTENYKWFIEGHKNEASLGVKSPTSGYYENCNSDGVCYVTNELQIFLQKFANSQNLFFDGNGNAEMAGIYSSDANQWLFACGYYKEK